MSDSDEERGPASYYRALVSRPPAAVNNQRLPTTRLATPSTVRRAKRRRRELRAPRRKEVPRDFLKGKIEKFTGKLERAKSAGNEEDITKCRPASQKPPPQSPRHRRDAIDATPSTSWPRGGGVA